MKPHIPERPTEADVKVLLDQMMPIFTSAGLHQLGSKVVWECDLPREVLAEARKRNTQFIMESEKNEYFLGYKGDQFFEPKPMFVPPPADRMGFEKRSILPGPKIELKTNMLRKISTA